jgi:hypothetical protein
MMAAATQWSTSCEGERVETSPMELSALGEHLAQCSGAGPRRVAMRCGAERLHGFVMARLVSAVAVVMAIAGLTWLAV